MKQIPIITITILKLQENWNLFHEITGKLTFFHEITG